LKKIFIVPISILTILLLIDVEKEKKQQGLKTTNPLLEHGNDKKK